MFNIILNAMEAASRLNSLETRKLSYDSKKLDFIKCISKGKISDNDLDEIRYIDRKIHDSLFITFILVDAPKIDGLKFDIASRQMDRDKMIDYIIIYRYKDSSIDDISTIETMFNEIRFIVRNVFVPSNLDIYKELDIELFTMMDTLNSRDRMIAVAPYAIMAKLFDILDMRLFTTVEFVLEKALNPNKIESLNELIKFIVTENPSMDTLFNLNTLLMPFW